MTYLPEIELLKLEETKKDEFTSTFAIEPLISGYGTTLGNTFRRILLSSLKGAAITAVKIGDATHEFTTVDGVTEDVVAIILNLKGVKIKYSGSEPTTIKLTAKGAKEITAADFKTNADVEIFNKDHHIATLDKGASLTIEAQIESGKGYSSVEDRPDQNLAKGMIAVDAIFTPIKKIHHDVVNTRVGQKTNFDKLSIEITTDGSLTPSEAMKSAVEILNDHLQEISKQIGKK